MFFLRPLALAQRQQLNINHILIRVDGPSWICPSDPGLVEMIGQDAVTAASLQRDCSQTGQMLNTEQC